MTDLSPRQLRRITVARLLAGIVLVALGLLLPAGTIRYWEAWVFMAVLFVPMSLFAFSMLRQSPRLLERRMRTRETEPEQRRIVVASGVFILAALVLPGLDRWLGWSSVPVWLVLAADLVIFGGYLLFVRVRGRTVEVEEGQRLITTGPYALVRHPLYLAAILIFGLTPLALGSYWGLIPAVPLAISFGFRIREEEKTLLRELPGTRSTARGCDTGWFRGFGRRVIGGLGCLR